MRRAKKMRKVRICVPKHSQALRIALKTHAKNEKDAKSESLCSKATPRPYEQQSKCMRRPKKLRNIRICVPKRSQPLRIAFEMQAKTKKDAKNANLRSKALPGLTYSIRNASEDRKRCEKCEFAFQSTPRPYV